MSELDRLRKICLALPDVVETASWGHANWRTGKTLFVSYEEDRGRKTASFFVGDDRREELLQLKRFSLPRLTDQYGWVSVRLDKGTDWQEVRGLAAECRARAGKAA